jgi:hypothetical protein
MRHRCLSEEGIYFELHRLQEFMLEFADLSNLRDLGTFELKEAILKGVQNEERKLKR